jgi:hypothetical protein
VLDPSKIEVGEYEFYAATKKKDSPCESTGRTHVTLKINELPATTALEEIKDVIACHDGQEHKIIEPEITGYKIDWYKDAGKTISASLPSQTEVGVTTAFPVLILKETGCESAAGKSVTVTVNELPAAPTITGVTECFNGEEHVVTIPEGQTIVWYNAAIGGSITSAPKLTNAGTVTAYAAAKNTDTNCESATRTAVSVTIYALPEAPTANNVTKCLDGNTYTAGAAPKGNNEEIIWYTTETGTETTIAPSRNAIGTTTAYAASKNNTTECESETRTAVSVTIYALPEAPTANSVTICYDGTAYTAGATPTGSDEVIVWYAAETGTETATAPSLTNAGTATAYAASKNTTTNCESETRTAVSVTIYALPEAPTANDITVCYDENTYAADATPTGSDEEIVWYAAETGTETATAPSRSAIGTTTAYAASKNIITNCESATRTAVSVTVNALPEAPTANNITVCYTGNTYAAGATPTGSDEEIVWYAAETGTETATAPSRSDAGTTTVYAASKNIITNCESAIRTAVSLTITPAAVSADISIDGETTICGGSVVVLTAGSDIENAIYKWYSSQNAADPFHTGNRYTSPMLTGDAVYYVSVAGEGVCENAGDRREVKIKVNPVPKLISPQKFDAICSGSLFAFNAETTTAGTQFVWERYYTEGIEQQAASGATGEIAETLDNTATVPLDVKYIITISSPEGCTAVETVTVTVNPISVISIIEQPADTTYCVCEKDIRYKLAVKPEANSCRGNTFFYQWYVAANPNIENGTAIPSATDSIFYTQSGMPVGIYYYYCKISFGNNGENQTDNSSGNAIYSKIAVVTVEQDKADIETLSVNREPISIQTSESEYSAQCGEEYITLLASASSEYANVTVIVNGREYGEIPEDINIPLTEDVTEIIVRIVTCDGLKEHNQTLTVTKSVERLIYQRWDNSLAVYRNPDNNGGYPDIRGVRWYKNGTLFETQTAADMSVPADASVWERWFIHLADGESTEPYSAELNIAGRWHRVCGEPVRGASVSKLIVYPNPVPIGENINVELPFVPVNGHMDIISLTGSVVKRNIPLTSVKNYISVSDLAPGMYILQITDAPERMKQTTTNFKLIVN